MKSLNSLKKQPNWYFAGARDSGPLLSHTASRYVIWEAKKIVSLMWLCLTETFDLWQKGWEFIPRDARERNTVISVDIRAGLYLGCQWLKRSDGSCWARGECIETSLGRWYVYRTNGIRGTRRAPQPDWTGPRAASPSVTAAWTMTSLIKRRQRRAWQFT